jgi:hypothetical protein
MTPNSTYRALITVVGTTRKKYLGLKELKKKFRKKKGLRFFDPILLEGILKRPETDE